MNRSAISASVTKEPCPMMMRGEKPTDYVSNFLYPNLRKNLVDVYGCKCNSQIHQFTLLDYIRRN